MLDPSFFDRSLPTSAIQVMVPSNAPRYTTESSPRSCASASSGPPPSMASPPSSAGRLPNAPLPSRRRCSQHAPIGHRVGGLTCPGERISTAGRSAFAGATPA